MRWVTRHKVVTSVVAACVVVVAVLSIMTSGSSTTTPHSYPKAASFSLPLLGSASGQHVSLSQYSGKPVIVNFWASWCAPCQKETPLLAAWYRQEKGQVPLIGLDENDTSAAALKFAHAKNVSYPLGFDPQTIAASAYNVIALPQTFFLNAQHRIVDHVLGAVTTADLAKGLKLMDSAS